MVDNGRATLVILHRHGRAQHMNEPALLLMTALTILSRTALRYLFLSALVVKCCSTSRSVSPTPAAGHRGHGNGIYTHKHST